MNSVSVILPTYNESENIVPLIIQIISAVKNLNEILVMDDNSHDHTAVVVRKWIKKQKHKNIVKIFVRQENHGLRQSISDGISKASGNIVVWMDADFSHPPLIIPQLVDTIEQGYDIAVASRYMPGGVPKPSKNGKESAISNYLSIWANISLHKLFGVSFYDFTSGFVAVRKNVLRELPLEGSYGEYFINFIIRSFDQKFRIIEVPYTSEPRLYGISKTAPSFRLLLLRIYQYGIVCMRLLLSRNHH